MDRTDVRSKVKKGSLSRNCKDELKKLCNFNKNYEEKEFCNNRKIIIIIIKIEAIRSKCTQNARRKYLITASIKRK